MPQVDGLHFQWESTPDIDLTSGWAIPLRAYLESWQIINYTQDFEAGYDGYLRATPEVLERGSAEWSNTPLAKRYIRANTGPTEFDRSRPVVGNQYLNVVRLEPIPNGFRAFVCAMTFGVYQRSGDAFEPLYLKFAAEPGNADAFNVVPWRIEFSNNAASASSAPPSPSAPQTGSLSAPIADVFGPWSVTGADEPRFWADTDHPGLVPGSPQDIQFTKDAIAVNDDVRQQCLERYPLNAEQRLKQATTVLDSEPAVEPAEPGWPDE